VISFHVAMDSVSHDCFCVMVTMIVVITLMNWRIAVCMLQLLVLFKCMSLVSLPCEGSSVRCNNTGACFPFWKACNEIDDCGDNTDEANCRRGYYTVE